MTTTYVMCDSVGVGDEIMLCLISGHCKQALIDNTWLVVSIGSPCYVVWYMVYSSCNSN